MDYLIYKVHFYDRQKIFLKGRLTLEEAIKAVKRLNKTAKGVTYHYCYISEKAS